MKKRRPDQSIEHEPHLQQHPCQPDPSEAKAERTLAHEAPQLQQEDSRVEHTVWDEPVLPPSAADQAADRLTFCAWLHRRRSQTSLAQSWAFTLLLALLAGPWALLGAFTTGLSQDGQIITQVLLIVVLGPVTEEMMKIAAVLYIVEKRPFLFKSPAQILLCVFCAGLVFAAVENLLYLNIYIRKPDPALISWRWSVCVFMHAGCAVIAGLGLVRIWRNIWQRMDRPNLSLAFPYILTAVIAHGTYNAFAVLWSLSDYGF